MGDRPRLNFIVVPILLLPNVMIFGGANKLAASAPPKIALSADEFY